MQFNFKTIQSSLSESEKGYADIFYNNYTGILKVSDIKNKTVYKFNEKTKLYQDVNENNMITVISTVLQGILNKMIDYVELSDVLEKAEKVKKIQAFEAKKANVGKASVAKNVYMYLLEKYEDSEFLERLDCSKYELPIKINKVVNLRTGEITDRTSNSFFTYELNIEYKKDANLSFVNKFFMDIASQNIDKYNYFQRVFGSAITADIKMKCFFILVGSGNNGKSVLMNAIGKLFKDMTVSIPSDLLFVEQVDKVNVTSYGTIIGKRIGVFSEPQSKLLQEASIKKLTGGDLIDGKKLYHNNVSFLPTMKIFITTNDPVYMDTSSKAMMKRVRVVNFNSEFVDYPTKPGQYKIDTDIEDKLTTIYKDELFTWLVNGSIQYFSDKYNSVEEALAQPAELQDEFNNYFNKIDKIKSFVNECCVVGDKHRVINTNIYDKFKDYCEELGKGIMISGVFYTKLAKLFELKKTGGNRCFIGLRLKTETELNKEDYVIVAKEDPLTELKQQFQLMKDEMNKYKQLYEDAIKQQQTITTPKENNIIKNESKNNKVIQKQIKKIVKKYIQPRQLIINTEDITIEDDIYFDEDESTNIDNFFNF